MWQKVLFAFQGRIGRRTYAVGLFANLAMFVVAFLAVYFVIFSIIEIATVDAQLALGCKIAAFAIAMIVPLWVYLALTIKRLHDIDKDSEVLTVLALPVIGWVLLTLELLHVERHCFHNRYGVIPKKIGEVGLPRPKRPSIKLLPKPA